MRADRLLKLAEHLRNGKLGHKKFDITEFNNADGPRCGTAGCAIGECPVIFPREWKWSKHGYPALRRGGMCYGFDAAAEFFEISGVAVPVLFGYDTPDEVVCGSEGYGLPPQHHRASRLQVAKRIEKFVNDRCEAMGRV